MIDFIQPQKVAPIKAIMDASDKELTKENKENKDSKMALKAKQYLTYPESSNARVQITLKLLTESESFLCSKRIATVLNKRKWIEVGK